MAKKTDRRTKDELRDDALSAQQGKEELSERVAELEAELAVARQEAPQADPPQVDPRLPVQYTDEYIQAREDEAREKGLLGSNVSVSREPFENSMVKQADQYSEGRPAWEVARPFEDAAKKHCPEGHTPYFLSPKHIEERGMRGWEFVKDKDGKQIRVASSLLGSMPNEKAAQRKKYFADLTRRRMRQTVENARESQEHAEAHGLATPGNELRITHGRRVSA